MFEKKNNYEFGEGKQYFILFSFFQARQLQLVITIYVCKFFTSYALLRRKNNFNHLNLECLNVSG